MRYSSFSRLFLNILEKTLFLLLHACMYVLYHFVDAVPKNETQTSRLWCNIMMSFSFCMCLCMESSRKDILYILKMELKKRQIGQRQDIKIVCPWVFLSLCFPFFFHWMMGRLNALTKAWMYGSIDQRQIKRFTKRKTVITSYSFIWYTQQKKRSQTHLMRVSTHFIFIIFPLWWVHNSSTCYKSSVKLRKLLYLLEYHSVVKKYKTVL